MWAFVLSVAGWILAALLVLLILWAVYVLYRRYFFVLPFLSDCTVHVLIIKRRIFRLLDSFVALAASFLLNPVVRKKQKEQTSDTIFATNNIASPE